MRYTSPRTCGGVRLGHTELMTQGLPWLVRAAIYYGAFQLFAPYAILFRGEWPRISEGAIFAVVAASFHTKRLRPYGRVAAIAALLVSGVYLCFATVWAAVTGEGYYGPVFWPAVGLLFLLAAASLWVALRLYRGRFTNRIAKPG
jgi:hypothetical protein